MSIQDFIGTLEKKRIKIKLVDQQLSVNSLSGKLSKDLIDEIKGRKAELIEYLTDKTVSTVHVDQTFARSEANRDIPVVEEQQYYDVSNAQRRMWATEQFGDTHGAYNMSYYQELGEVDPEAVVKTMHTIVERFEILRTAILTVEGEQKQRVIPFEQIEFEVERIDLTKAKDQEKRIQKLKQEGMAFKYDLSKDLLIQAKLIQLRSDVYSIIINLHHIVFDGWSKKVLDQVFDQIYQYHTGSQPELPSSPKIQYKDYTSWQKDQIENGQWESHRQYWTNQFADTPAPLDLVHENPRTKLKDYKGAGVNFLLDKAEIDQLNTILKKAGGTLFMGLLTLVKILMSRYTRQQDITIGTPIAGRDHVNLEDQLGFFVNTLALRTKFSSEDNYIEVLEKIKQTTFDAYEHQQYPFDTLVQDLHLGHDMSRTPLFDVMVLLHNVNSPVNYSGTDKNEIGIEKEALSRFDMTFNFTECSEGVLVDLNYSTQLFSETRMVRLAEHLRTLLKAVVKSPVTTVGSLKFISDQESKVIENYNDTATDYPRNKTIQEVFGQVANEHPDQTAFVFNDTKLTYRELDIKSNQVAHCLRNEYSINNGDVVALVQDRSASLMINILGTLKAGAAYLPLDLTYPADRLAYMIKDCEAKLIIHDKAFNINDPIPDTEYLEVDQLLQKSNARSEKKISSDNTADSLAYVMYTSGSTGQPKGVYVRHRSVVRLVKNTNYIDLTPESKLLQTGSLSFDAATFEIYGMLLNGGELHMLPSEDLLFNDKLKQKLTRDKINVMWLTSSWFNQLVDDDIDIFQDLKELLIGGEKLSSRHVNKVRDRHHELTLINGYGPTENTTFSICKRIDQNYRTDIPLGKPIANSTVYILDDQRQIVPEGVIGEIYLGGDGLAKGYANQLELNAQVFVSHPFREGEKLYKTGDLGYWLPGGEIGFRGRKDVQIKLRGYRIEPGEIEAALAQHEGTLQCAVRVFQETSGEKYLAAFYTGEPVEREEWKNFLAKKLPPYMIPSVFSHLSEFPLTANGKLDYSNLPKPENSASEEDFQAPSTDLEKRLAAIWMECLGNKKIGVRDNFFEIGGHSLNATKMLAKVHKEFNVEVTLTNLFEGSTIAELAECITGQNEAIYQELTQIEDQEYYAISNAQRRLWVIDQFDETKGVYNIPTSIKIPGLNKEVFEQTIYALIERHEILRTTFIQVHGEPRQRVKSLEESGFKINHVDLRKTARKAVAFTELKEQEGNFLFDLQEGPLIRITLVQLEDDLFRVLINMHHIISDGWSKSVLEREYDAIYDALLEEKPFTLRPLQFQYKDYSAWQKAMLEDGYWDVHKNYWHQKLSPELPVINLPLDHPRPEERIYTGLGTHFILEKELSDKIVQLCQQKGVTLFMGLMTFVELLLHKYTRQNDIIIGTPIAGRDKIELEDQIGFYVNTLALRCQFDSNDSISALFDNVRTMTLEAYEHQQYPFDSLIDELALNWSVNRAPLFDVMVDLQNFSENEAGSRLLPYVPGMCRFYPMLIKFDLSFTFTEMSDGIVVNINYNHKLFDHTKVDRMIGHFIQMIETCIEDSSQSIAGISYLTEKEETRLLTDFNDFDSNTPPDKTLIQLFEEQVKSNPHHTSLLYEDRAYTFGELNEKANQMANYLVETFGINQGDYVAIQMDESDQRIIALLALLKLRCVYVPMDKEAVTERMDFIIENADIKYFIKDADHPFACTKEVTIIDLVADTDAFSAFGSKTPEVLEEEENVFAILYTSGSTGQPKGVHIGNKGIVNRIDWLWNKYNFTGEDVIYQKTPFVFDVSIGEIFMPLAYGATLLVADSSTTRIICKNVIRHKVTYIHFPPTPLNDFLNAVTDKEIKEMTSLRYFIASGEALLLTIVKKFYQRFDVPLINLYGPTEASIEVSYFETSKHDQKIPIGKPIANVPLYVLDENNQVMPIGIPGEIAIGGIALSQGYVNLPEMTEEKFIKNPFLEGKHERIYKTGDIGQWNDKGEIEFLGRRDNQTSINGSRIELEEVEAAIISHPEISAAAVAVKRQGDKAYLVAHYVKNETHEEEEANNFDENQLLTEDEAKMIDAINSQTVAYPKGETIHQSFEIAANKYADLPAIRFNDSQLTYRQLNEQANQLANYIADNYDIPQGALIGILQDRSAQLMVSLLAVLKLGAGYVTVDKDYPEERIAYMLNESAAPLVIADFELDTPLYQCLNVQDRQDEVSAASIENPERNVSSAQVAYTMFTSGSTGKPKGVVISHESVMDYCHTFGNYFNIDKNDVVIQQASFSFDTVVEEVFPTLMAGGQVIMLPNGGRDVDAMMDAMIRHKATVLSTTPLVINEINGHEKREQLQLKILISGGDALKASHIDQLINEVDIFNTYGPTEATVCTTFHQLKDLDQCNNIGKPIANHQVYLLNDAMEQVALGCKGEVYLGGKGLAIEYLNRPELTAEFFVENPFEPGTRLYKTGDMAQWTDDGNLLFLGRKDRQLKVNGYRVELNEVEQRIAGVEKVKEAVVQACQDLNGNNQLVGYYTTESKLSKEELRTFLADALPPYMIPAHLVSLEKFPVTANGKINHKALPIPGELTNDIDFVSEVKEFLKSKLPSYMLPNTFIGLKELPMTVSGKVDRKKLSNELNENFSISSYAPPTNEIQQELVGIWQKVLGIDQIGIMDSLFELGGNSLKATQIIARIHQQFEVAIKIGDLFKDPTIQGLEGLVGNTEKNSTAITTTAVKGDKYPVSFAQRRLWVIEQFADAGGVYNMPFSFTVHDLDRKVFEQSIKYLLERHEVLRTTFGMEDGSPVQIINSLEKLAFKIQYHDLRKEANATDRATHLINADAAYSFDLENEPLIRVTLLELPDQEFRILLNMHHIISDGASIEILEREFNQVYANLLEQKEPDLPAMTLQYKDYTMWQLDQLNKGYWEDHRSYWHDQFGDQVPVLELPTDTPRTETKQYDGSQVEFVINAELKQALKTICQEHETTFHMGLLSLVNAWLYKYTGQHDLVLGAPIAGRHRVEFEEQLGFYVNTLALRTKFDPDQSFIALLKQVKSSTLGAYENQQYPFDLLVDELALERDMSRNPLFDVIILHEQTDHPIVDDGSLHLSHQVVSKFDLNISFTESPEGMAVAISFVSPLYAETRMQRMAVHLKELVSHIVADPTQAISQVDFITDEEQKLLSTFSNGKVVPLPESNGTIHEQVEAQCLNTPDLPAVWFEDKVLTYGQVNDLSNQIANYLIDQMQIGRGDLVGMMVSRTEKVPVILLGILKAGASYVPLDPDYPKDRITFMMEDTQMKLLITDDAVAKMEILNGQASKYQILNIDRSLDKIEAGSVKSPGRISEPTDRAYVIYTSGTTGRPKGVSLRHENAVALINWSKNEFSATEFDVTYAPTSYCFDLSVFEMFYTLSTGKQLRILNSGLDIPRWVEQDQNILINTVPSVVQALLSERIDLTNVKALNMAGEAIPQSTIDQLDLVNMEVRNLYGPSEYATYSTCHRFSANDDKVLIGEPLHNTQVLILDEYLNLRPIGVVGEVYITGPHLSEGYINRPELTHEKFIDHPFDPSVKLYRTGDLASWTAEGKLDYIGRIDSQIKLRGYRIELGEIETVLTACEQVEQGVVDVKTTADGEKLLCGYYIGEQADDLKIREGLKKKLPNYMIPDQLIHLDKFPLSPNGKISKDKLPNPLLNFSSGEYIKPETPIEIAVANIWATVLGRDKVSLTDNFFNIGGQSLKAMQVISRVFQNLNVTIGLKDVFAHPTVKELSDIIEGKGATLQSLDFINEKAGSNYDDLPLVAYPIQSSYPVSFAQRRLWIIDQFDEAKSAYNIPETFELDDFDQAAFEKSINQLLERHEILRTKFSTEQGEPVQIVESIEALDFSISYVDLSKEDQPGKKASALQRIDDDQPFDLVNGPLLRVVVYHTGQGSCRVALNMHHIISDAWSAGVLEREFNEFYSAALENREPDLPSLSIQYKDFTLWQHEQFKKGYWEEHRAYWHSQFSESQSPALLLSDLLRPRTKTYNGSATHMVLGEWENKKFQQLCTEKGATPYVGLLTLVTMLLHKYTTETDITLGTPMAGRNHLELENQLGFYVNTMALRNQFEAGDSFDTLLSKTKKIFFEAWEHQQYPFDLLVDELALDRDMSRSPLFDIMVVYDRVPYAIDGDGEISTSSGQMAKFDVTFVFSESTSGLSVAIDYNKDLFTEDRMIQLTRHLQQLFKGILENSSIEMASLDYLSDEERSRLLADYNDTTVDYPEDETIVSLFENQVTKYADHQALVVGKEMLSYEELNAKANQLANYLIDELQVKQGECIGVSMERSAESIICLLGIMKAGAVYLPIDPNYPGERKQYMIENAEIGVLLAKVSDHQEFEFDGRLVAVDQLLPEINTAKTNPEVALSPKDPAYTIYTSGSTGRPKGVLIAHTSNINMSLDLVRTFGLTSEDRVLQFASMSFDASIMEIFMCFYSGATLVMAQNPVIKDTDKFIPYLKENAVSTALLPPSYLSILDSDELKFMRVLITGGEAAHTDKAITCSRFLDYFNAYGPTECAVCVSTYQVGDKDQNRAQLPIGKPMANTKFYILDANQQLVPEGTIGEIYISGVNLAIGYLNNPEKSKEAFIPNPYKVEGHEQLYKTGDLGRWLPDSNVEFVGRKDDQVKIRGFRIELGEVESQLATVNDVKEVVVLVRTQEKEKYLVAYYVADKVITDTTWRQLLAEKLPDYMLPNHFVHLDRFPLNTNGKVDRKALPDPDVLGKVDYEAPTSSLENEIVDIWAAILKLDRAVIGVNNNFFSLGGHSLNATQISSAIFKKLKKNISIKDVFNNPTIRELSQFIEDNNEEHSLLVRLNDINNDNENLFFVPPILGSSTIFRGLANQLSNEYNVYGLQHKGFDYEDLFDQSIEQMADTFNSEVKKIEKSRSVRLVGYSMGVPVVFEMAKSLEEEGYKVSLVLLDRGVSVATEVDDNLNIEAQAMVLFEEDLAPWVKEIKAGDRERVKQLIINNLHVINQHVVNGEVEADILAVEASANELDSAMDDWSSFTKGEFSCHQIETDHYSLLNNENLAALAHLIDRAQQTKADLAHEVAND